jgi:hypothetical protein
MEFDQVEYLDYLRDWLKDQIRIAFINRDKSEVKRLVKELRKW